MTMGADLSQQTLMTLFRTEAGVHSATLCSGLLELPADAASAATWFESLMRAGHSIKGAARIVGLEALVALAHAIEDRIVRCQRALQLPAPQHVDAMLAGADVFGDIAGRSDAEVEPWIEQHGARIAALAQALATETSAAAPPAPAPAPAPTPAAAPAAEPVLASTPAASHAPAAPARPLHADSPGAAADGGRMVRLSTDTLNTMLAQARETLLVDEAREAEARVLQRLSRRWRHSMSAADQAIARLSQPVAVVGARHGALDELQRLREGLRETQVMLTDFAQSHDRHSRRGRLAARQLYQSVRRTRMTTLESSALGWRRLVHELGRRLDKPAQMLIEGQQTLIDRDVLERIEAPLNHLIGNAMDHGLEAPAERAAAGKAAQGQITLRARHHKGQLLLELADDGRGIDDARLRQRIVERGLADAAMAARLGADELREFLFLPGFSTRDAVSDVSGRGVGLDVVRTQVQALGGAVQLFSIPGQGSRFVLSLPVSISVLRALLVQVDGELYAFALSQIERVERLDGTQLQTLGGCPCVRINGSVTPVVSLASQLGLHNDEAPASFPVVVVGSGAQARALRVDRLLGERNLGLLPLDPRLGRLRHVSAAAILEDGAPVLVLDCHRLGHDADTGPANRVADMSPAPRKRVLVVEDSFTVREVERQILLGAGYEVEVRVDGEDGWQALAASSFDLMITDIDMPRLNGIELLRRVRGQPRLRELPVMIVSYKDSAADRQAGLDAGADRYFIKSNFDDQALLAAVVDLVGAA